MARDDGSMKIIDFQNCKEKLGQREFAKEGGVLRTTLQTWLNRINVDPSMVTFLESPAGVKFLHILIQALLFNILTNLASFLTETFIGLHSKKEL